MTYVTSVRLDKSGLTPPTGGLPRRGCLGVDNPRRPWLVLDAADTEVTVPAIDLQLATVGALTDASKLNDLASVLTADSDLLNQYHGPASLSCRYTLAGLADIGKPESGVLHHTRKT